MAANSRVNTFKDVRNAPLDQDNSSQPTALFLMVLNGRYYFEGAPSVIPACSPSIHSCCIRDARDYNSV